MDNDLTTHVLVSSRVPLRSKALYLLVRELMIGVEISCAELISQCTYESLDVVQRELRNLEKYGMLIRKRRADRSMIYILQPPEQWRV